MNKYIVTITPPTPNGDLHLGHLSGPFLAADVCCRTLKQQGHDVLLLSYSDDYQSYMRRKAKQLRKDPVVLAQYNSRQIQLSMEAADIEIDYFLQASNSDAFQRSAKKYFMHARTAEQLLKKHTNVFYCSACDVYGYEGLGRGHCNWCGAPSDASQCEACARIPDVNQMHAMQCMLCHGEMKKTNVERWAWKIGANYAALREHYRKIPQRAQLRAYLDEVLLQEKDEWDITRPGDAGLELEGITDQPLHTWFMGLAGYHASLDEYLLREPERGTLADWWNPDTKLVHFLGFDCSYSHAVAYAALQTLDKKGPPPGIFLTNLFLKLDGQDFSTSRGHAVWIREITGQHPVDAIRLYMALHSPEFQTENFDRVDFEQWRTQVFDHIVCQFNADMKNYKAVFNDDNEPAGEAHGNGLADIVEEWNCASALPTFSIAAMARAALKFAAKIEGHSTGPAKHREWQTFAQLIGPLCPALAEEIETGTNKLLAPLFFAKDCVLQ